MAVTLKCPHCSVSLLVDDGNAGRTGRCSNCKKKIRVPDLMIQSSGPSESVYNPQRERRSAEPEVGKMLQGDNEQGNPIDDPFSSFLNGLPGPENPEAAIGRAQYAASRGRRSSALPASLTILCAVAAIAAVRFLHFRGQGDQSQDSVDADERSLPLDFAFLPMTTSDSQVDLLALLSGTKEMIFKDFNIERMTIGRDAVCGINGDQLHVKQESLGLSVQRLLWEPEPFACYRDGNLLGIWDPENRSLRMAGVNEADAVLEAE